jgi:hypothetical protein
MRRIYWAASALFAALLVGTTALAMQIPQFDRMDFRDRSEYRTLLVKGVYDDLTARGETDQAEALLSFFKDRSENGGFRQFDKNLDMLRALDQDTPDKTSPYEVEDVMALTLKNNGILVPVSTLLAINKNFRPSYAPAKGDVHAPSRQTT